MVSQLYSFSDLRSITIHFILQRRLTTGLAVRRSRRLLNFLFCISLCSDVALASNRATWADFRAAICNTSAGGSDARMSVNLATSSSKSLSSSSPAGAGAATIAAARSPGARAAAAPPPPPTTPGGECHPDGPGSQRPRDETK